MDRRKFLKISLAGSALAALPAKVQSAIAVASFNRFKVSVVRRHCFDDLQSCYLEDPEAGMCPVFADDFSEVLTLGGEMPSHLNNRFCKKAWKALCDSANKASGCTGNAEVTLASCGDPTRPVIFKIERL